MVLGTHVDLSALTVGARRAVDVLTGLVGADEAHALDVGVLAHMSHSVAPALDNVHYASGDARLLQQVN